MRVVMVVYNDVVRDARVLREARTLVEAGHEVVIVGRPADPTATEGDRLRVDGIDVVRVPAPRRWRTAWRLVGRPLRAAAGAAERVGLPVRSDTAAWLVTWWRAIGGWARRAAAEAGAADVVHAHDLSGALALRHVRRIVPTARWVYDSHEILLESRSAARQPDWARRLLARLEAQIVREATAVVTVNEAVAAELERRYGRNGILAVHNCPPRQSIPLASPLRDAIGVGPDVPIVIAHGSFVPDRGLAETVDALRQPGMDDVHGVFLGFGPLRGWLEAMARDPGLAGRLHVLDPVTPEAVPAWVAGADAAVMPIGPGTLNHRLSTPNKLFESLAAGVPVVASAFPAMRRILLEDPLGPLGAVCDPTDPRSIAAAIRSILELPPEERAALRARCRRSALERWNWETEGAKLVRLYERLERAGPGA
ncbi:MAG: hypothetical protein KatS3mg065_0911 [Chloroflexota bacterium]|nr:MAG: hypothetical protein KatS3mg065_0911 [Chloroflexota bacterium]